MTISQNEGRMEFPKISKVFFLSNPRKEKPLKPS
jgi:hypothetical protein